MRNLITSILFIIITCFITTDISSQNFLKTSGKNIIDINGQEILLRGIGLGGWLVPEGYMIQTSSFANAAWQFREKIEQLIGVEKTNEFFKLYRENFVTRKDIQKIKEWGFNSIRLPMHFNLLTPQDKPFQYLEEGFAIIDSLLSWCEENKLYLILDLHAAPGGQSKDNIADYNPAFLPLWEDPVAQQRTIHLWQTIAARYSNKVWIGGYDLINETAYNFPSGNNQPLRDLYISITNAIRQVDKNHIIFIEGNWYATDFNNLTPPWNNNLVYSFHKYWNSTDIGSINYLISLRNNTNCPLWLGESGENSNQWFTDVIKLMGNNNIGWAWWTLKKLEGNNSLMYVYKPIEYDNLLKYWNGQASKPSVDYAVNALTKFAQSLNINNCKINDGVIDAMFRQVKTTETLPFSSNFIPGTIYATDYDYGQNGFAYKDNDYQNTGNNGSWNTGGQYRNDGVDIERCYDIQTNGYNVGWINTGEFLNYTVNVQQSGIYNLTFRYAANASNGKILMRWDGQNLGDLIDVPNTGGWTSWKSISVNNISLTKGTHTFSLTFFFGGFNLNYVKFDLVSTDIEEEIIKPSTFKLEQNYPNPFNPTTTIQFVIPNLIDQMRNLKDFSPEQNRNRNKNIWVTLKIYDMLGKEVATLVNEEKKPGTYNCEWRIENGELSSGIYYYMLKVGGQSKTRKMILLK